jgi:hypothetical protein
VRAVKITSLHRQIEIIERIGIVTGGVLDRQSGNTGVDAQPNIRRDFVGIVGVAALKICIERNIRRVCEFTAMREHHIAVHVAIRTADRMSVSGACRGQRLESKAL